MTSRSGAQIIYSNNFNTDDSPNWAVNFSYTGGTLFNTTSNNLVNFNFDYTTAGLPIAPHSDEFGSTAIHHGLKISAIYTNAATLKNGAAVAGMSVCPTNFSISSNFVMHADMWINVNCGAYAVLDTNNETGGSFADNNHDGTASTVFYGCGYGTKGTAATTPGQTDAIWVGSLTDNGSSAQIRMYGPSSIGAASYQDASYQTSGNLTPAFPGDPYVYNNANGVGLGNRNIIVGSGNPPYTPQNMGTNMATGVAWRDIFPSSVVPLAQQILYPQQTNNCSLPGFLTFKWHDVSVEKVGNVIIYKVDGNILATGNYASAGTPPGGFLTFVASRTGSSVANASSGVNYTNLNFAVFANIVVSNFDNVVNVTAPTATCQEGIPASPGVFTITRGSAGVPLTVNYTLTGTATNGVNYQILTTNVTFASTATSTNISVVPIDDGIPGVTSTVILTLQSGDGYAGAGSAIISILDGDTPTVDITSLAGAQAYGRYTGTSPGSGNNDYIPFTLTRRGNLTTGSPLTVNLAYSGSAVSGTDFAPVSSVSMPDGAQTATLAVPPLDNPSVTTNRTVIVSVASVTGGTAGTGGPATGTIVSAHYDPPVAVLLTDDLQSAGDAVNWSITYGTGDPTNDPVNYSANFGYSLSSDPSGNLIPPPPGGNSAALHLTCNKQNSTTPAPGAVNCYYTNLLLSGNFAVRFNMNIIEGQLASGNSEGPVFGINHTGSYSNWWYGGGTIANQNWSSDGVWYWINAQPLGAAVGDYLEFTGLGGTNGNTGHTTLATTTQAPFAQVFKDGTSATIYGPFTTHDGFGNLGTPGVPANGTSTVEDDSTWSDVEIKQLNNIVTLSINHTKIFSYTNTTVWTNGYLMLGYADPFGGSVGSPDAGVYYANLQVVQLAAPVGPTIVTINSINITGGNVVITFTTSNTSDTTGSFTLQSAATVNGAYSAVTPTATITSLGGTQYQATTPYTGGTQFYRILHN